MTVENFLTQMGLGTKQLTERYAEYPAQAHDHQQYYAYEQTLSSPEHVVSSKHHYSGGGHKSNGAMSALTLLAFLFFLHILQQCLKDHMMAMSTPQVMVVSAGREGEQQSVAKIMNKLDKGGVATDAITGTGLKSNVELKNKINSQDNEAFVNDDDEIFLMKIKTAEHTPHRIPEYDNKLTNYDNSTSVFSNK